MRYAPGFTCAPRRMPTLVEHTPDLGDLRTYTPRCGLVSSALAFRRLGAFSLYFDS